VTPWVLDILQDYGARATFFCVGDNVTKHPAIFRRILDEGHAVGNHTYHHLNGRYTDLVLYINNVRRCAQVVKSRLFRPPYGRLMPRQRYFLQRHFRIVMWDVLSGDYDRRITPEQCFRHIIDNAGQGSIVLMHDSLKAERNLRGALPAVLEHFAALGYRFESIRG
jgi:peptidoglycan/xylan/chitin deacetylase (PgdA/CDA1 family)